MDFGYLTTPRILLFWNILIRFQANSEVMPLISEVEVPWAQPAELTPIGPGFPGIRNPVYFSDFYVADFGVQSAQKI